MVVVVVVGSVVGSGGKWEEKEIKTSQDLLREGDAKLEAIVRVSYAIPHPRYSGIFGKLCRAVRGVYR